MAQRSASNPAGSRYARPWASATAALTSSPATVESPRASAGSAAAAPTTPRSATRTRYGRVALVSAKVEVRATAPGMLATQ